MVPNPLYVRNQSHRAAHFLPHLPFLPPWQQPPMTYLEACQCNQLPQSNLDYCHSRGAFRHPSSQQQRPQQQQQQQRPQQQQQQQQRPQQQGSKCEYARPRLLVEGANSQGKSWAGPSTSQRSDLRNNQYDLRNSCVTDKVSRGACHDSNIQRPAEVGSTREPSQQWTEVRSGRFPQKSP